MRTINAHLFRVPRKLVTRNSKSYQISISSVSFRSIFSHEPQFIDWWEYHLSKQTHQRTEFTKWMYPIAITTMFVFVLAFAFVIPNNTLSYHETNWMPSISTSRNKIQYVFGPFGSHLRMAVLCWRVCKWDWLIIISQGYFLPLFLHIEIRFNWD